VNVAEATISPEQGAAVFAALEEARFFGLPERWPPGGVPVEGDVVVVAALVGTRAHRVVARPAEALPPSLARVVHLVAEAAPDARMSTPARHYWRVESLEAGRAERVRRRGLLPHLPADRGPPLPPSMLRAVTAPSEWMAIDAANDKRAQELAGASRELVLEGPSASWLVELWQGDRSGD
jgi:hypothetical protein